MFAKWGGGEVLKKAVRGMLPKNRLRNKRMERLKVFEGTRHPYTLNVVRFAGEKARNEKLKGVVQTIGDVEKMKTEIPPEKVGVAKAET